MGIVVNKRLLNTKEAAVYLSLSTAKLHRMAKKGEIPSVLIGGSRRFDVAALDDWVDRLSREQNHK